jgi:hypothetical protein
VSLELVVVLLLVLFVKCTPHHLLLLLHTSFVDSITYSGAAATLRSYVTANDARGSYTVSVNMTSRLQVGQW